MTKIHTLVDQPLHCMPHAVMLLSPPASEEGDFHIDEALVLVSEELLNDRVQDVLNACILYVVLIWNVNYSSRYRQYCVILNTTLHMLGCHIPLICSNDRNYIIYFFFNKSQCFGNMNMLIIWTPRMNLIIIMLHVYMDGCKTEMLVMSKIYKKKVYWWHLCQNMYIYTILSQQRHK